MNCFMSNMREKEVINLKDGCRLGAVCDVEFDACSGNIISLIIFGKGKLFGILGHCDDIKICWDEIKVIGDDTILVDIELPDSCKAQKRENALSGLFSSK